jgi:class 3 adenylate cyclase
MRPGTRKQADPTSTFLRIADKHRSFIQNQNTPEQVIRMTMMFLMEEMQKTIKGIRIGFEMEYPRLKNMDVVIKALAPDDDNGINDRIQNYLEGTDNTDKDSVNESWGRERTLDVVISASEYEQPARYKLSFRVVCVRHNLELNLFSRIIENLHARLDDVVVQSVNNAYSDILSKSMDKRAKEAILHNFNKWLNGVDRAVTVMFTDIRGSGELGRKMEHEDYWKLIKEVQGIQIEKVVENSGYVAKLMGDGMLAVFGLFDDMQNSKDANSIRNALSASIQQALSCGVGILEKLKEYNDDRPPERPKVRLGIGIHCGRECHGILSGKEEAGMNIDVTGDTINRGSRYEQGTKLADYPLIVSEEVYSHCIHKDEFEMHPVPYKKDNMDYYLYKVLRFHNDPSDDTRWISLTVLTNSVWKNEERDGGDAHPGNPK